MGAGTTPLYTLGPAYMDENVNPKVSPIYLGIWFATTFLGPGMGFAVGGAFLRTFTDLKVVSTSIIVLFLFKRSLSPGVLCELVTVSDCLKTKFSLNWRYRFQPQTALIRNLS